MYEAQKVAGGYQVWWHGKDAIRPTDDERIYPSRQNAYVAKDRLNDTQRGQTLRVTIRLTRQDCQHALEVLRKKFGDGVEFSVIDPLNDLAPDVRDIAFQYRCASPLPEAQVTRHRLSRVRPPMSHEELSHVLRELAAQLPIVQPIYTELLMDSIGRMEIIESEEL